MSRPSSAALAVGLVVVLVGLVASTAHTTVWAPAREGSAPLPELLLLVATVSLAAALAAGVGAVVLHRRERAAGLLQETARRIAPGTIVGIVLVSLAVISRMDLQSYREPDADVDGVELSWGPEGIRLRMNWGGSAVRRPGEEEGVAEDGVARPDGPGLLLGLLLIVGAVGLVAVATAWWSTRRRLVTGAGIVVEDPRRAAAHGAVESTIDAMLADPDPRTAIIGAYARLLEELSANGAPREDYEGPVEHLRRALTVLDVRPGPLERLIRLFEEARFSTHHLTARHRDRALDALRTVAADLSAPASAPSVENPA